MRVQVSVYLAAVAFACSPDALGVEKVVVYSSVKIAVARAVAARFEKEAGTKVRLVPNNHQATSKELLDRLIAERKNPAGTLQGSRTPLDRVPGSCPRRYIQQELDH